MVVRHILRHRPRTLISAGRDLVEQCYFSPNERGGVWNQKPSLDSTTVRVPVCISVRWEEVQESNQTPGGRAGGRASHSTRSVFCRHYLLVRVSFFSSCFCSPRPFWVPCSWINRPRTNVRRARLILRSRVKRELHASRPASRPGIFRSVSGVRDVRRAGWITRVAGERRARFPGSPVERRVSR